MVSRIVRVVPIAGVLLAGLWALGALSLADRDGAPPRIWLPIVFGLAFVGVLIFLRPHWRARLVAAAMVLPVAVWYFTITPSNDREWAPQYAKLATATIDGDRVTLHNYRVLQPGPDGVLQQQYVDRTFDVSKLLHTDLIISHWGPKRVAHAQMSFEFSDGDVVAMSIEVRRRASQKGFDAVSSFFRNFELIYVVGNERALFGSGILDDYHRIHLYRTNFTPQRSQALFMRYSNTLNELVAHPQWYNTVTDNCTTSIYKHLRNIPPPPAFSMSMLVNGYLPEYCYQQGKLDTSMPWEELQRRCDIKEVGRRAYHSPDFSRLIRESVPMPGAVERSSP
ncbi:MAG: DUF4105 domain-containing protein [Tepidisphaeraceae bacterium]